MKEFTAEQIEQNAIDALKAEPPIQPNESAEEYVGRLQDTKYEKHKTLRFPPKQKNQGFRTGQLH